MRWTIAKKRCAAYNHGSTQISKFFWAPRPPAYISCVVESPPVVFHGSPQDSTRAMLSGLLHIHVEEQPVVVCSFMATLRLRITNKRPKKKGCQECMHQSTELKTWTFLAAATELPTGQHHFPFSELLEGSLPASIDMPLGSISYHFEAVAIVLDDRNRTSCYPAKFERTVLIKRSIPEPLSSLRTVLSFDTGINIMAQYDQVIYPTGTKKMTLGLNGLRMCSGTGNALSQWVVRVVTWKLDENITTNFAACHTHSNLAVIGREGEVTLHKKIRTLGYECLTDAWKADYSTTNGTVEVMLEYGVAGSPHPSQLAKYACDVNAYGYIKSTHVLHVCIALSTQSASETKPLGSRPATCTLSMTLPVTLTEPGDSALSWENESLPIYRDSCESPPVYIATMSVGGL
ncbi:hypothetical protein NQ176_g836 [Zarea fungicola]|uniref:Uncharacterized protein n=1 Tax=Zarea fungicola TaxID=93591 RepID=A0ACC1NVT3_9HYPO|nr:hypothetical protein NQ176_g836 [Lecanicillium fungicola]